MRPSPLAGVLARWSNKPSNTALLVCYQIVEEPLPNSAKERLYNYFGDQRRLFETVLIEELEKLALSLGENALWQCIQRAKPTPGLCCERCPAVHLPTL